MTLATVALLAAAGLFSGGRGAAAPVPSMRTPDRPDILIVTVDTLRSDRLGSYGYSRPTSPNLDRLLEGGVRFTEARVVEPLTNPSLCSMLTSLYPQDHGATRNGLRMHRGLVSLPKVLRAEGYYAAAFVGNWTLRDKLSGLGEHFDRYDEILTRKRWFGFLRSEATAEDLTDGAVEWLDDYLADGPRDPVLLWVHYVEPHAPYRLQEDYREPLGIPERGKVSPSDRYDTEVAFVDHHIGRLIRKVGKSLPEPPLIVFASDHGESLGEHDYWGHGRNLHEPNLRIPMGLHWEGRLAPATIDAPAVNLDLAPTVLSLLGIEAGEAFRGHDWTSTIEGGEAPANRVTWYQAHRGAVISKHESDLARHRGLLAVGMIEHGVKEVLRLDSGHLKVWNLETDPGETRDLAEARTDPSAALVAWMEHVEEGLVVADNEVPAPLDDESVEQLRALGYVD